jgi:hypothetical protein
VVAVLKRVSAPLHSWEDRRALRSARRAADAELIVTRLPPPRLAWRWQELVAEGHRLDLGRAITDVVHASDERFLPSASPLDRGAVRACRAQLLDLASRLFDLSRPVMPRGVLLVERLLDDNSGPLFGRTGSRLLALELKRTRAALEREEHHNGARH